MHKRCSFKHRVSPPVLEGKQANDPLFACSIAYRTYQERIKQCPSTNRALSGGIPCLQICLVPPLLPVSRQKKPAALWRRALDEGGSLLRKQLFYTLHAFLGCLGIAESGKADVPFA